MSDVINKNFLSQLEYKFVVNRLPHINWFMQRINIPGIQAPPIESQTPFRRIPVTADALIFDSLRISFKIDEDMNNYFEIVDWMHGTGFPDTWEQYAALKNRGVRTAGAGIYSDGTLSILNSNMVKNIEIVYHDLFPVALSEVNFDVTDPDVTYLTCDVEFQYLRWTRRKIS